MRIETLLTCLSLLPVLPAAAAEKDSAPSRPPAGSRQPPAAGAEAPARQPPAASAKAPATASTVRLPPAGEKKLADILALARPLYGRQVSAGAPEVEQARIIISRELGGQLVGREEISILLAAHGFRIVERNTKKGKVLVAVPRLGEKGRGPALEDSPRAAFSRKFEIRNGDFDEIAREVEEFLTQKNRKAPAGEPASGAALDPRTRRIIVRAASEKILAGVDELISRLDRPDPSASHLYTYAPRCRRAEDLVDEVIEAFGDAELEQVSLVVPRKSNLILIRTTEEIHRKVEEKLKSLNVPRKVKSRKSKS